MTNLTADTRLVRLLETPRTAGGCHVVVFKESRGGRTLSQILPPGQPFRPSWLDRFGNYAAYAVSADPARRHTFSRQLTVGTGKTRDHFTCKMVLEYRVAHPEVVADLVEHDPLGALVDTASDALERRAETITFESLVDTDFDVEAYVLERGDHSPPDGGATEEERLHERALDLGLEVRRVNIVRTHSVRMIEHGEKRRDIELESHVEEKELEVEERLAPLRARVAYQTELAGGPLASLRRGNRMLESVTASVETVLGHIAGDIDSSAELGEAARELSGAVRELVAARQAITEAVSGADTPAAIAGSAPKGRLLPATAPSSSPLVRELRDLASALDGLDPTDHAVRGLAGRVLRVLGAICLDDGVDGGANGAVASADDLDRFCGTVDLSPLWKDQRRFEYFGRFRRIERLRDELRGQGSAA